MPILSSSDRKGRADFWTKNVNNLPPFPRVVQEAMSLLDSQRSSAADVARVVSRDEAITAKILRMVNSAFYGLPGKITTVSHAVTLLGFEQLRLLMVGVALLEQGRSRDALTDRNRRVIWEHSSACARWAQELAKATRYQPAEEAMVAGLLHDVGKIVLAISSPAEFAEALSLSQKDNTSSFEAEEKCLGFNHVETGKMIAERWRLPALVRYSITLHHSAWSRPLDVNEKEAAKLRHLLAVVQVANQAGKQSLAGKPIADPAADLVITINPQDLLRKVHEVNSFLGG